LGPLISSSFFPPPLTARSNSRGPSSPSPFSFFPPTPSSAPRPSFQGNGQFLTLLAASPSLSLWFSLQGFPSKQESFLLKLGFSPSHSRGGCSLSTVLQLMKISDPVPLSLFLHFSLKLFLSTCRFPVDPFRFISHPVILESHLFPCAPSKSVSPDSPEPSVSPPSPLPPSFL